MTSPSPRTICFVYFALLFGTAHADTTDIATSNSSVPAGTSENGTQKTSTDNDKITTNATTSVTIKSASVPTTSQTPSDCTTATPKPTEGQCILLLPTGEILHLVVAALIVGCFALLVTTLICICQVCHLRGIISSLQHRHNNNNVDLRAIREKSKSPNRDEGQGDGQPTETCLMLSEVITTQEDGREDEERVLENKTEEKPDSTEKDPNGDITQENSGDPEAKAPESSDNGV